MNKIFFAAISCILMSQVFSDSPLIAFIPPSVNYQTSEPTTPANVDFNRLEFRSAAFVPTSGRFRELCGNVGVSLQAEYERTLKNHRNLEIWGNTEWVFMDGKRNSCGHSDIDILNFNFGLKFSGKVYHDIIGLYAGIGPDVGIVFLENKKRCCHTCNKHGIIEHKRKAGIGGIVKTGVQFYIKPHLYFDIFADYLYLPIWFHHTLEVGGLRVGGGFGGTF